MHTHTHTPPSHTSGAVHLFTAALALPVSAVKSSPCADSHGSLLHVCSHPPHPGYSRCTVEVGPHTCAVTRKTVLRWRAEAPSCTHTHTLLPCTHPRCYPPESHSLSPTRPTAPSTSAAGAPTPSHPVHTVGAAHTQLTTSSTSRSTAGRVQRCPPGGSVLWHPCTTLREHFGASGVCPSHARQRGHTRHTAEASTSISTGGRWRGDAPASCACGALFRSRGVGLAPRWHAREGSCGWRWEKGGRRC